MEEQFTINQKVKKFEELHSQYLKLVAYRGNLSNIILSNLESTIKKTMAYEGYVLTQQDEKLGIDSTKNIQSEIARVDAIISFIGSVIYDDQNTTLESRLNNQ